MTMQTLRVHLNQNPNSKKISSKLNSRPVFILTTIIKVKYNIVIFLLYIRRTV